MNSLPQDPGNPSMELALSELRRSVDVGLAKLEGQLALLLQRSEQAEHRADQQGKEIDDLWGRLGKLERDAVTRSDIDGRTQRFLMMLGIIVAVISVVCSTATSLLVPLIT